MSDRLLKESDVLEAILGWETDPLDEELERAVKAIPSADDRQTGKWIRRNYWSEGIGMGESYGFYYECSNCGKQQQGGYDKCGMNFCPACGARMLKGADDE